jgi:hypothetical protein
VVTQNGVQTRKQRSRTWDRVGQAYPVPRSSPPPFYRPQIMSGKCSISDTISDIVYNAVYDIVYEIVYDVVYIRHRIRHNNMPVGGHVCLRGDMSEHPSTSNVTSQMISYIISYTTSHTTSYIM